MHMKVMKKLFAATQSTKISDYKHLQPINILILLVQCQEILQEHLSISKYSTIKSCLFPTTVSQLPASIISSSNIYIYQIHSDDKMKVTFPLNPIATIYKRGRYLKRMITPSLYPRPKHTFKCSIRSCRSCDMHKTSLYCSNTFTCTVT